MTSFGPWTFTNNNADDNTFFVPQTPRDRDLIIPDEYLTEAALDGLWDWFCTANKNKLDPQLVFVKLINSARKPYRERLSTMQSPTINDRIGLRNPCYTPSESMVLDQGLETSSSAYNAEPYSAHDELQRRLAIAERNSEIKQSVINDLRGELLEAESRHRKSIEQLQNDNVISQEALLKRESAQHQTLSELPVHQPVRVAIKSACFKSLYLRLNATNLTSFNQNGGGEAGVQDFVGALETFNLIYHRNLGNNVVSFKSAWFENVYLRADRLTLRAVDRKTGGGLVNAQFGCGGLEKFKLCGRAGGASVAIESMAFPGTYLRMIPQGVNLQGVAGDHETFYLVLLP